MPQRHGVSGDLPRLLDAGNVGVAALEVRAERGEALLSTRVDDLAPHLEVCQLVERWHQLDRQPLMKSDLLDLFETAVPQRLRVGDRLQRGSGLGRQLGVEASRLDELGVPTVVALDLGQRRAVIAVPASGESGGV